MSAAKQAGKMSNLINYRMRVTMLDGRQLTGTLLAFDKFMNVVLADTEEFRRIKRKATKGATAGQPIIAEEKRTLGLIILRGGNIVSLSVESPPPADPSARLGAPATGGAAAAAGPGIARQAGRGLPTIGMGAPPAGLGAPPMGGLAGPMRGAGPVPGMPPPGFPPGPAGMGAPPGFAPPPGYAPPPGFQGGPPAGRGFPPPPPGFGGR